MGWLTTKLLSVTLTSAEWVLWLLAVASILSVAVIIERALYFRSHRVRDTQTLVGHLAAGKLEEALALVEKAQGMEAAVVREAVGAAKQGPGSTEEAIARAIARERPRYERFLSFLGTLGSNAPFIGLFGTVLGIIKAFNDLGMTGAKGQAVQQAVMAGISEALVATAVGLFVAIPAVVAYNTFTRALKNVTASTHTLGHALLGHLKAGAK